MSRLGDIGRKILFSLRRSKLERELGEEMQYHLEQVRQENIRAGVDPREAARAARQERSRRAWGWPRLENFLQDLSFGLRILRRSPGFVLVAVLSLGLGIGVNATVFTLVDGLFARPIPAVDHSEDLISIFQRTDKGRGFFTSFSWPEYEYYREHGRLLSGVAATATIPMTVRSGSLTGQVAGGLVSANYFTVLGVQPEFGRSFRDDEGRIPGAEPIVILAHRYWEKEWGGDPAILGRQIGIGNGSFTVIGVSPPGFEGLLAEESESPDLWIPMGLYEQALPSFASSDLLHYWGSQNFQLVARLRPGTGFARARAEVLRLGERIGQDHPERAAVWPPDMQTYADLVPVVYQANAARFWPGSRDMVIGFLGMISLVAILVLIMGCLNVANLLMLRAARRSRELAVRLTLGAGRSRLAAQLLTENLLLVLLGGTAALLFAAWTTGTFSAMMGVTAGFFTAGSVLGRRTIFFILVLVLAVGAILTALPIRAVLQTGIGPALRSGAGSGSRRGPRSHEILVTAQLALSLVLLFGAGLFVQTLRGALSADITWEPEQVLMARLDLETTGLDEESGRSFYERLLERLDALPGLRHSALVYVVPLGGRRGGTNVKFGPAGEAAGSGTVQVGFNVITPGYFGTIGIPLLQGRDFSAADRASSPPVAVVNEEMIRRFFPDGEAIGRHLARAGPSERPVEIVGVVRDGKFRNYRSEIEPTLYLPLAQAYRGSMNLEVRAAGPPESLVASLRRVVADLDDRVVVTDVQTLAERFRTTLRRERLSASALSLLGLLALLLAAIGIFGLLTYTVAERTREIGVRISLGARPGEIVRMVLNRVLRLMIVSSAAGTLLALGLGRVVRSLLYGVRSWDPGILLGTVALLAAVAALAGWLPARWAGRIDPVKALRHE